MDSATTGLTITDMYMSILSSLSRDEKLDLISKLKASLSHIGMEKPKAAAADPFAVFGGNWGGNLSTEEYCEQLREAHTFNRTVETW